MRDIIQNYFASKEKFYTHRTNMRKYIDFHEILVKKNIYSYIITKNMLYIYNVKIKLLIVYSFFFLEKRFVKLLRF